MAEQVTGSIGQEQVVLNNAASEATLLKLLEAVKAAGGAGAAAKAAGLAGAAGIDPATVRAATAATQASTAATASGTSVASDLFSLFGKGSGATGLVTGAMEALGVEVALIIEGFKLLYQFQQENFEAMRATASAGATFAGALTQVRLSAASAYLDLNQFSQVVKNNSDIFASMGGNVQDGVNQFVRIQNKLLAPGSEIANNLATLGFGFEDAAELTASYMRAQGNMNKEGLKNTTDVTKAIQGYAQELTLLSEISGKSREEIQKQLDKENMETQWQALLARMSPDEARKAQMGLAQSTLQGQGAIDNFKAKMMGFPPLTEQGQLYAATQRAGMQAIDDYVKSTKDASISAEDAARKNREALAKSIAQGAGDMDKMRTVLQASGLTGGALSKTLADAQALQTKFMKDGKVMSESEIKSQLEKMDADTKRGESEAAQLKESEARMRQFYTTILNAVSPLIATLTSVMTLLIKAVTFVLSPFVAIGKAIISVTSSIIDQLMPVFNRLGTVIEFVLAPFKFAFDLLLGAFTTLGSMISNTIGFVLTPFIKAFDTITEGIKTIWEKLKNMVDPIIEPFRKLFDTGNSTFGKFFGYIADFSGWLLSAPFKLLFGALGIVVDVLTVGFKVLGGIVDLILAPFQLLFEAIDYGVDFVAGIFESLGDAITFVLSPFTMIGTALNSLYEGIMGLLQKLNPLNWFSSSDSKTSPPKMANGGIVNKPTNLIAGEAGAEAIVPLRNLGDMLTAKDDSAATTQGLQKSGANQGFGSDATEILTGKLDMLNNLTQQMLRHMQDTADNTKKNIDATRALNGNLFAA